jgi:TPR repeat protein
MWFRKAAFADYPPAQYEYGNCCIDDLEKALKWWTKAAENDDLFAQLKLCHIYGRGDPTRMIVPEVFMLYSHF